MIIAPAIKTKKGKIYISRSSHSEILMLYPDEFELAEKGFITSECKFVDRKEALKIAKKYKQINSKIVDNDELYSEDLFLVKEANKRLIEDKQKLIEILEKANKEDTETVKRYEEMRRDCIEEFYRKSYQTQIHKLNAKREVRKSILEII